MTKALFSCALPLSCHIKFLMNRFYRFYGALLVSLALGMTVVGDAAKAQPIDLPGSADPSRVMPDFQPPDAQMRRMDDAARAGKAVSSAPEGAENEKFILRDIRFKGMTAYSSEQIRTIYKRHINQEISVKTLFDIMADVHNRYLQDGYTLTHVSLPAQDIKDGIAEIDVVEGYISKVELDNGVPGNFAVTDAVSRILAMHPVNTVTLERLLLVLNNMPRLQVSAIIGSLNAGDPGFGKPGAVRLVLQNLPEDEPLGSVSFDNHGSVFAGPFQWSGAAYAYDLAGRCDTLGMNASATFPFQEERFIAFNYTVPVYGASGTELQFAATFAKTAPGDNLKPLEIRGNSQSFSAGISYPLILQRGKNLKIDAGFDIKNSSTDILGDRLYKDRLRVLRARINYSGSDSFYGVSLVDFGYAQGIDIFGIREEGSLDLSRLDGDPTFHKFNLTVGRLQSLPRDFELYGIASAQYAFEPLLSAEEFGFGGASTGRGYNPSEITGDKGVSASLELRKNIPSKMGGLSTLVQPYVFYDLGKAWNLDTGNPDSVSAASTGLGSRFNVEKQWDINLNWSLPLTKDPEDQPRFAGGNGSRVLLSIQRAF